MDYKKPFQVIVVTENEDKLPLTIPIQDTDRAALAYNALYTMMDNGAMITVNGTDVDFKNDRIQVVDASGITCTPPLDKEWYGTEADNEAVKNAILDINVKEELKLAEERGAEIDATFEAETRELEAECMDRYSALASDKDGRRVWFAPESWDFDKACEMVNLMHFGMDDNVTMSVMRGDKRVAVDFGTVCLTDHDGQYYGAEDEPWFNKNWALSENRPESENRPDLAFTENDLAGLVEAFDLACF